MRRTITKGTPLTAGILLTGLLTATVQAQTSDALLNKLVEKGILSIKEAEALKKEADEGTKQANPPSSQAKAGLADWVTSLKFSGDLRLRYESFFNEDDSLIDRHRFRYRLRFGTVVTLKEQFEVGLRLTSGDETSGRERGIGDPLSGNTTLTDNASKKGIYVDLAYAKWTGLKLDKFSGFLAAGKMESPFVYSSMLFDADYTPEGLGGQLNYKLGEHHNLKLIGGGFSILELGSSSYDSFVLGSQLRLDSAWAPPFSTSAGVGIITLLNEYQLLTSAIPNQNAGNSRVPVFTGPTITDSRPAYHFNPVFADASATYNLERFPGYKGAFPVRLFGEYMVNPAAEMGNKAYQAGLAFGKSGKKGMWELSYAWRYQGANSWFEEFVESDFGANYVTTSGDVPGVFERGYHSGTNVRGHIVKAAYSFTDYITLATSWYRTELINENIYSSDFGPSVRPIGSSEVDRLQVDATWKF